MESKGAMGRETHADQHVQLALMRMDMDDDDDDIRSASSALRESTTNLHR
jgi:hypothetical protein